MKRHEVFDLILDERARQEVKWANPHSWGSGDCSSPEVPPIVKVAVLTEEPREVTDALLLLEGRAGTEDPS